MLTITTPPPTTNSRNDRAFTIRISGSTRGFTAASPWVEVSESIPESFLAGWADYQRGRVIDMERALGDEPPAPM